MRPVLTRLICSGTLLTDKGIFDAKRSKEITSIIATTLQIEDLKNRSLPEIAKMLKTPATSAIMETRYVGIVFVTFR